NMATQATDIMRMLTKGKKKGVKKGTGSAMSSAAGGGASPGSPIVGATSTKRQRTVSPDADLVVLNMDPKGK
ncbi:hypothetical protein A2U01_0074724, partial [Trifolium medium]|nr:hypothetical protein [Trifolium medium]